MLGDLGVQQLALSAGPRSPRTVSDMPSATWHLHGSAKVPALAVQWSLPCPHFRELET